MVVPPEESNRRWRAVVTSPTLLPNGGHRDASEWLPTREDAREWADRLIQRARDRAGCQHQQVQVVIFPELVQRGN